jgi:hypothetical protein
MWETRKKIKNKILNLDCDEGSSRIHTIGTSMTVILKLNGSDFKLYILV